MVNNVYGDELPGNCYSQLSYSNYWLLFTDVPTGASYGRELCAAMTAGWIAGYDNVTFRPNDAIKISEASKIIAKAYGLSYGSSDPSVVWYGPYVEALRSVGGIPDAPLDSPVTPDILGQMLRSVQ